MALFTNYDTYLTLSDNSINELQSWVNNIEQACRYITTKEPDLTIYTDANLAGWGVTNKINPIGGFWHNDI